MRDMKVHGGGDRKGRWVIFRSGDTPCAWYASSWLATDSKSSSYIHLVVDGIMLFRFKYGLQLKETFGNVLGIDQVVPRILDDHYFSSEIHYS